MDNQGNNEKRILIVKRTIICLGVCIIIVGLILINNFVSNVYFSYFSQQKWMNNPGKRYMMVDNLIESEMLKGLSKEEVYSLLGEKNSAELSEKTICFSLGGDFFMNMLLIEFDDSNIVVDVSTYVD